MTTLKKAIKEGKLDEFIKEHENDAPGDEDKLDKLLNPLGQDSSQSTEETSDEDVSDDCDDTQTRQDT